MTEYSTNYITLLYICIALSANGSHTLSEDTRDLLRRLHASFLAAEKLTRRAEQRLHGDRHRAIESGTAGEEDVIACAAYVHTIFRGLCIIGTFIFI